MRTFLFLHGIARGKFQAIKNLSEGLLPRTHGHTGRIAPNALVQRDIEQILSFVTHYTETNAILPGWIPGYKRDDIQLLPSTTTKKAVCRLYQKICTSLSVRAEGTPPSARCGNTPPTCRGMANDRPLLDLPTEQHCNRLQCGPDRGREV